MFGNHGVWRGVTLLTLAVLLTPLAAQCPQAAIPTVVPTSPPPTTQVSQIPISSATAPVSAISPTLVPPEPSKTPESSPTAKRLGIVCEQGTILPYTIEQIKEWVRPLPYQELMKPVNVPESLQSKFRAVNPGRSILYVGKKNEGNKMNAVLTDRVVAGARLANGFGWRYNLDTKQPIIMAGEFEGIVSVGDGTTDFYVIMKDPIRGERMVVRFDLNPKRLSYTRVQVDNYGVPVEQQEAMRDKNYRVKILVDRQIPLEKFMKPGDFIFCFPALNTQGKLMAPDQNGVIIAQGVAVARFEGYQEVVDLFR